METKFKIKDFDQVLIALTVLVIVWAIAQTGYRYYLKHAEGNLGYIATATYTDPKSGMSYDFKVSKWLDSGQGYSRFLTQDGKVITLRGNSMEVE